MQSRGVRTAEICSVLSYSGRVAAIDVASRITEEFCLSFEGRSFIKWAYVVRYVCVSFYAVIRPPWNLVTEEIHVIPAVRLCWKYILAC